MRSRILPLVVLCLLAGILWWRWGGDAEAPAEAAQAGAAPPPGAPAATAAASAPPLGPGPPFSTAGLAARERQRALWQMRYERAAQTYMSYRDATRYPPEARPLAEHPDQVRPFEPVSEELPLRDAGGKRAAGVRIRATQERIFVTGDEAVRLTLEATDAQGRPVPLSVRAAAQALPDSRTLIPLVRVDLRFADDGQGGDEVAGDGRHSARLHPLSQGFGQRAGTIRVLAEVSAGGEQGLVPFDVVYEPAVAGTWEGVREALEEGALNFYLKARVRSPGRYVASARVFDARGQAVALLQFNEDLPAGAVEFRLSLAGVLVHDLQPVFPLRLVDVEAFLLKPDTFPDRAMLPRLAGVGHVSGSYRTDQFSDAEWRSEERDRHLAEFARDLQESRDALARLAR